MEVPEKPSDTTTAEPGPGLSQVSSDEKNAASNEESGVADISSTDDQSSTEDESKADADEDEDGGEDALVQAALLKEQGNNHFQSGEWDEAARCYRRGSNRLKKLSGIGADPQVKPLQLTLQTNLSMVLFKQKKYRASRDMAGKALSVDQNHVKALYRRAVASRAMGDLDEAKSDLRAALSIDSKNVACRKEQAAVKKQLELATQQQKSALAKAFSSGVKSSFLYDDKEEEEKQKLLEKQRQKQEKEKRKEQQKKEWEDECVSRMARGEEVISFDDWVKEQEEAEKKKREEQKKQKEAERLERQKKLTKEKPGHGVDDDDDDNDELTEQELASLRGYKKTKDGRTTSYFTREISEEERQRMGDMAPKKLNCSTASNIDSSPSVVSPSTTDLKATSRPSAWNQAGTWEEKDCTSWCKDRLTGILQKTYTTGPIQGAAASYLPALKTKIATVENLTGEGSVAITGGRKRYIFDFHAELKYEIHKEVHDEDDTVLASGMVRLPDICSTHYDDEELEVAFDSSWTKAPSIGNRDACSSARLCLANELRTSVQNWVQEFNKHF